MDARACVRREQSLHETSLSLDRKASIWTPLRNQLSDDCPHRLRSLSRESPSRSYGNHCRMAWCVFFFPLDTFLLSKYFDIRSLMYFAIISKHFRNFFTMPRDYTLRVMFSLWLTLDSTASCVLLFVICTLGSCRNFNVPYHTDECSNNVSQSCCCGG